MMSFLRVVLALVCWVVFTPTANALPCVPDDALSEAAANLVLDGQALAPERVLDGQAISRALRQAGSDLPAARALVAPDEATAHRWLDQLARGSDAPLVCGVAAGETSQLILASPRGGRLRHEHARIHIELSRGFTDPYLVLRGEDDALSRADVNRAAIPIGPDIREVQLVATGPSGPRPVASLRIDRSTPGEASAADPVEAPAISSDGSLSERLMSLREHDGASDLRPNRLLAAEAQRHAEHVCRSGSARHSQGTEDPEARLARRGIRARVVGEAVARARSVDAAFDAIAQSASHRLAVVDRRFTDVGIGVARHRETHCVVISLAAWPRAVPR